MYIVHVDATFLVFAWGILLLAITIGDRPLGVCTRNSHKLTNHYNILLWPILEMAVGHTAQGLLHCISKYYVHVRCSEFTHQSNTNILHNISSQDVVISSKPLLEYVKANITYM